MQVSAIPHRLAGSIARTGSYESVHVFGSEGTLYLTSSLLHHKHKIAFCFKKLVCWASFVFSDYFVKLVFYFGKSEFHASLIKFQRCSNFTVRNTYPCNSGFQ